MKSFVFLLKFVPKGPINTIPALVQIMVWRRTGDKPLSELMMTQFNGRIYASLGLDELTYHGTLQMILQRDITFCVVNMTYNCIGLGVSMDES